MTETTRKVLNFCCLGVTYTRIHMQHGFLGGKKESLLSVTTPPPAKCDGPPNAVSIEGILPVPMPIHPNAPTQTVIH